jgi:hypothetical protein
MFHSKSNYPKLSNTEDQLSLTKKFNIIIADDETIIRSAAVNLIQKCSSQHNIKINIIQVEDGIETLFAVYKCLSKGVKINFIISDESMNFMKGSESSNVVNSLVEKKGGVLIPFYLVTAYDSLNFHGLHNMKIIPKPLTSENFCKIIGINS